MLEPQFWLLDYTWYWLNGVRAQLEVMIGATTAIGTVTLNKPYQATTVDVFESAPSAPVILDLTLDIIDNMLIVSPPKEEVVLVG